MAVERWERYGYLAGPAFVGLILASAAIPGKPPDADAGGAEILKFFIDKGDSLQVAGILDAASTVLALWWVASLWRAMTKAEYGKSNLALITALGFTFGAMLTGLSVALWTAGGIMGADMTPEIARFAFVLAGISVGAGVVALAASTVAASALALHRKYLPTWLGYYGFVPAALFLIGGLSSGSTAPWIPPVAAIGFLTYLVWVVAVSVALWRSSGAVLDLSTSSPEASLEQPDLRSAQTFQ